MALESLSWGAKCVSAKCISYHNYQHIWFIISFNLTNTNKFQLMPMQTLEEIVAIDLGKSHG